MGGAARPLSAELLRQGPGRPHRRPEWRMEGARGVDDERRPGPVAQGRRQGYRADRLSLPVPPRPARRLTARGASSNVWNDYSNRFLEVLRLAAHVSARQRRSAGLLPQHLSSDFAVMEVSRRARSLSAQGPALPIT